MIFFESFSQLGYSAWNIAVAFFFLGAFGAAMLRLNRRPLWAQLGYSASLVAAFALTIVWVAPLVADVKRANEDWEARRDADPRVEMQRQQR